MKDHSAAAVPAKPFFRALVGPHAAVARPERPCPFLHAPVKAGVASCGAGFRAERITSGICVRCVRCAVRCSAAMSGG